MELPDIVARATAADSLLLATDFDGTISEVVQSPEEARAVPGALSALSTLARAKGVHVALVSGRSMESLRRLTAAIPHAWRVAEHGAFIAPPGDADDPLPVCNADPDLLDVLEREAGSVAARFPGMRVERKTASVAVHVREVDPKDRDRALAALDPFRALARRAGLDPMEGRQVVEARHARCTKEAALAGILTRLPAGTLPIYAGDDTTDEGALSLMHALGGIGIYVASGERPATRVQVDTVLAGPMAWIEVLRALAARRGAVTDR
jgi:trehalose-phosphatase